MLKWMGLHSAREGAKGHKDKGNPSWWKYWGAQTATGSM